ncbi:CDGSH iron-sulfur domain-containing protein [uncultured Ilumatobacter sp.]|jgi:CDGSH-type Zn-finger protein|uniref:CDGSH iron-sulfur domain-containing protein n=1 Tax=uncultured Ilumatobacter sp. TaxID=879968 RepID=UPI00374F210F
MSDEQKITVAAGGPYLVSGGVPVMSEHGEPLTWKTDRLESVKAKVALCRCGASSNKPFCDGSHKAAGFTG